MSSLKRKYPDSPDDSDHENPVDHHCTPRNLPKVKRRRFDLTRNLSRLSLFEQAQAQAPIIQEHPISPLPSKTSDQDITISPWSPFPQGLPGDTTMDMNGEAPIPVINHSIVEEPIDAALTIPEVRMRHTSSYELEKDRIVVTDLDSSEDEAETPPRTSADGESTYSVSHAFLSRVKPANISIRPTALPPNLESNSSHAVVLFRPSPWSAKNSRQLEHIYRDRDEENLIIHPEEPQIEEPDADAMEIE